MPIRAYRLAKLMLWITLILLLSSIPAPQSVVSAPIPQSLAVANVLYDGALNSGTPDTQGFLYLTRPLTNA
jgi:hypothetical protein